MRKQYNNKLFLSIAVSNLSRTSKNTIAEQQYFVVCAGRDSKSTTSVQVVAGLLRFARKPAGNLFESRVKCLPDISLTGALIKTAPTNVDARF